MFAEYFFLFVITPLAGAWATGVGILFGLEPIAVWIVTASASILTTAVVLFVGGPWRDRLMEQYVPDAQERVERSGAGHIVMRWGVPGLAVSSVVLGPTLSLAAVLLLGVDRRRYFLWNIGVAIVGFGIATAFWHLVLT